MSELSESAPQGASAAARWKFLRDVAVFEAKLSLNNFHNFFQVPLTLAVAVVDRLETTGASSNRVGRSIMYVL